MGGRWVGFVDWIVGLVQLVWLVCNIIVDQVVVGLGWLIGLVGLVQLDWLVCNIITDQVVDANQHQLWSQFGNRWHLDQIKGSRNQRWTLGKDA